MRPDDTSRVSPPRGTDGQQLSHIELSEFLHKEDAPKQQALLRSIRTLVNVP